MVRETDEKEWKRLPPLYLAAELEEDSKRRKDDGQQYIYASGCPHWIDPTLVSSCHETAGEGEEGLGRRLNLIPFLAGPHPLLAVSVLTWERFVSSATAMPPRRMVQYSFRVPHVFLILPEKLRSKS
ncbi:hypothetical protein B296_00049098 [Ensete ventricosum]|uniref:Uncharacterized protein n=1 Tax=Ensete ventricosum TaxID=4639 RepID=A0A426XEM4_ENSVE|nr:hypothetical protein B296_00049098 [Ensete ventricosum]